MLKAINSDVLKRFIDQGIVSLGNFVIALLLARLLGPHQFGLFAVLWIVVTLTLGGHWALITSPLQIALPHTEISKRPILFGALFVHALILGIIAAILSLIMLIIISDTLPRLLTLISVPFALFLILAQEFSRRWLLGTERPGKAIISDILRYAGTLTLLTFNAGLGGKLTLGLCMSVIAFSSLLALMPISSEILNSRIRFADVLIYGRRHYKFGRWLLPSVVLQSISSGAPIYAISGTIGMSTAGGYRAAMNLLTPVVSLTEALETFLPLRCSQVLQQIGYSGLQIKLLRWAVTLGLCCSLYAVLVWLEGVRLLDMLFGKEYRSYAPVLLPLGVAMSFQFATYILNVRLRTLVQPRSIFIADVFSTFCMLALLALLPIDTVGVYAAFAVAVSQAVKFTVLAVANFNSPLTQTDSA